MKHPKNVLDCFSGIGGFSLGLHRAGVKPKWIGFSDIDKHANKLFKRRFKNVAEELGTITDISYKTLKGKRIDLLTGGFPCQAFSIGGARRGFKDTRGTLFFEVARILKDYIENEKPIPCILLENVKGLLNHDSGRTFAVIHRILSDLNYNIECQLVNTKWWLPQNRERVYILGRYNGEECGQKILPIRGKNKNNDKQKTDKTKELFIADYRSDEGIRPRKNGISPTLTCSTVPFVIQKNKLRNITPIEAERLQGFPDNWTEGQPDRQRYKQCGNAVSPPVTETIFKKLYNPNDKFTWKSSDLKFTKNKSMKNEDEISLDKEKPK